MSYARARAVYLAVVVPVLLVVALIAVRCNAPTFKLAGTAGTLPVFVDSSRVGDSLLSQVGAYLSGPQMTLNGVAPSAPGDLRVTTINGAAPPTAGGWSVVLTATLQAGSLGGWNQRIGVWTADGTGFHTGTNTGAEVYLSYESGGVEAAPFPMYGIAMQVEFEWTASAATTDDVGLCIRCLDNNAMTNGATRIAVKRNGTALTADYFGSSLFLTTNPALGTFPTGVFHTLKVEMHGTSYAIFLDGVYYYTASFNHTPTANSTTSFGATRVGLWANNGNAVFRNAKIWRVASPT